MCVDCILFFLICNVSLILQNTIFNIFDAHFGNFNQLYRTWAAIVAKFPVTYSG